MNIFKIFDEKKKKRVANIFLWPDSLKVFEYGLCMKSYVRVIVGANGSHFGLIRPPKVNDPTDHNYGKFLTVNEVIILRVVL